VAMGFEPVLSNSHFLKLKDLRHHENHDLFFTATNLISCMQISSFGSAIVFVRKF
jgi:hypothetical protein